MLIDRDAVTKQRRARGWSQRDLATEAGVTRYTVQGIETGRHQRTWTKTLRKLAAAFEVDLDVIAVPEDEGDELFLAREKEVAHA